MLVGGVGTAIYIHFIAEFEHFQEFRAIVIFWLIGAAVCDLTITAALTCHLVSAAQCLHLPKPELTQELAHPPNWISTDR